MDESGRIENPPIKLSEYRKIRPHVKRAEEMTASEGGNSKARRISRRSAAITALDMNKQIEELQEHALEDPLTGLKNRRWFNQEVQLRISSSKRSGKPLFLIFLDFDDFKKYNTAYGHSGGDKVLKQIATLSAREDEPIARFGGDEFVQLVNRDVTEQEIVNMIKRYQEEISENKNMFKNMQVIKNDLDPEDIPRDIKITFGVAKFNSSESVEAFEKRANKAAHHGKNTGKDAITLCEISNEGFMVFRDIKNG